MFFIATKHSENAIKSTQFSKNPYQHIVVDNLFSDDVYKNILENKIPTDCLSPIVQGNTVGAAYSDKRYILPLDRKLTILSKSQRVFWESMYNWLDTEFKNIILDKFKVNVQTKLRVLYTRDFCGYKIGPHTDNPLKIITLLIYIPSNNDNSELGTSLYTPKENYVQSCEGMKHHKFENFNLVKTIEYIPNRMFGFMKTNKSFHGVSSVNKNIERNILIYDISSC